MGMPVRIWPCFLFVFPSIQLECVCLENKAAPGKAAQPALVPRPSDIKFEFRSDDNHHLIVHECSRFEPGDARGLRATLDFISERTDPDRPAAERLHAIW